MNQNRFVTLGLAVVVVAAMLGSGCRRKPSSLTYIPGQSRTITNEPSAFDREKSKLAKGDTTGGIKESEGGIPMADRSKRDNMNEDREFFKVNTVYFDFDRHAVKSSERRKVEGVAKVLKERPEVSVEVEGHCDERGTEEYNRALGERRALAVREYLINLGVSSDRVFTMSFGKDKPVDTAHSDAAWAKNRRGEFVLLTPKP